MTILVLYIPGRPSIVIKSTPFHSQECPCLDGKLHGPCSLSLLKSETNEKEGINDSTRLCLNAWWRLLEAAVH